MGASREEIAADLLKVDNAFKDAERQLNELEKIEQVDSGPSEHISDFFTRIRALTPGLLDLQTYNQLST